MSHILKRKFISVHLAAAIFALLPASCGHFYTDILKQKKIIIPHSSNSKDIISFSFEAARNPGLSSDIIGSINGNVITVTVPNGIVTGSLVATFIITGNIVSVNGTTHVSGITSNNFTGNVTYTVTASDATTKDYVVTVVVAPMEAQWARTVTGANNNSYFGNVSVASDGSVYAAGSIYGSGTFDFGNGVSTAGTYAGTGGNIVLVKYNNSGTAQWARTVTGGSSYSGFHGVSGASDGSVYSVGQISTNGTFNFGNGVTTYSGSNKYDNCIVVKYNSAGDAQWARTATGGSRSSYFSSVSVASGGSVFAAGYVWGTGTIDFGNGVTAAGTDGYDNCVVVKYNSYGIAQWVRTVTGGSSYSGFRSVSVASDDSMYCAGYIYGTGTYNFGNGVTAAGTSTTGNLVLLKYKSSGTAEWARTVTGGSSDSYFSSVSVASGGSVFAAGYIYGIGTYNFGNGVIATGTNSNNNILLVKYE
jgi:hypothetical protein